MSIRHIFLRVQTHREGGVNPPLPRNCKAKQYPRQPATKAFKLWEGSRKGSAKSGDRFVFALPHPPLFRGEQRKHLPSMKLFKSPRAAKKRSRACNRLFLFTSALTSAALLTPGSAMAVAVRGVVTDPLNHPIAGAIVALVDNGKIVITARTGNDGSYSLSTSSAGRYYVLATGNNFRQLLTESFYGGAFGSVEKNITLEPSTIRQSVVVTATGTPVPQTQVSASITELSKTDLEHFQSLPDALRLIPGFVVATSGERGGVTSLFVRGGNSDDNKVLLDGVPLEDIGGTFDFTNVATTGIASVEAYRGPDSVVYGTDAGSGVVALSTPRGSTPFPSVFYEGDGGNFGTYRNQVELGGTHNAIDYYGAFGDYQTSNSVDSNRYHDVTSAVNVGYALSTATQLRVTSRNSDSATGVPGQYAFTLTPTAQKQGDQDLFLSGTLSHTFSDRWNGEAVYGLARKRERFQQFGATGTLDAANGVYLGQLVSVTGANGYTVSGQAITAYQGFEQSISDLASNRDSLHAQTSYAFTPHLLAIAGFRYADERGLYFGTSLERTNYDYTAALQGDFSNRLFYTLGGGVEKNGLYGTVGAPHLGVSYYLARPGRGLLQGTRLNFNFSKGYKEPTLGQQIGSLATFLTNNGGSTLINQYQVQPIGPALTRSYDGGIEQSVASERILLKLTYFHNEFGSQIESVGPGAVPQLLPQLTAAQQASLEAFLQANGSFGIDLNSLSFRAQGVESELTYSPSHNIFLRGGYTYLDAVVQKSFSSDALDPQLNTNPAFPNILIGNFSPLVGARPFRRPPHTGFVSMTYTAKKWTAVASGAFAGRADDSTALGGSDANFGNSLLLPNRDLDSAFTSLNADATYQVSSRIGIYAQLDNLLSQQHISPIGYLSTPASARGGVRLTLGHVQ
jgi:vitamin B12 transporter